MTTYADNSLEAIFHRRIQRALTPRVRSIVMGAFHKALEIYEREGEGQVRSAQKENQRD